MTIIWIIIAAISAFVGILYTDQNNPQTVVTRAFFLACSLAASLIAIVTAIGNIPH